jgi:hypothetical protein
VYIYQNSCAVERFENQDDLADYYKQESLRDDFSDDSRSDEPGSKDALVSDGHKEN